MRPLITIIREDDGAAGFLAWPGDFDLDQGDHEVMASMRDGYGNTYRILFSAGGAFATGFDHESALSPYLQFPEQPWPGRFDGVPEAFRVRLAEPAFCDGDGVPEATVCFWREAAGPAWRTGNPAPDPDGHEDDGGAARLFHVLLDGSPDAYRGFAEKYYGVDVDPGAVRHVYALRPLTREVVHALNPRLDLAALAGDIAEIGYPSGN